MSGSGIGSLSEFKSSEAERGLTSAAPPFVPRAGPCIGGCAGAARSATIDDFLSQSHGRSVSEPYGIGSRRMKVATKDFYDVEE